MKKPEEQHEEIADRRINIQLTSPEEHQTFRKLKLLATLRGESMKDIVVRSLDRTISEELSALLKREQHGQ